MQPKFFGRPKSLAGAVLVGFGALASLENAHQAATRLELLFMAIPAKTLGVLPAMIVALSHVWQTYAADPHRFLAGLLHRMLLAVWPLLLVMIGAALSRENRVNSHARKNGPAASHGGIWN